MAETTRTSAIDFLREVRDQVAKVTWPDAAQLKNSTGVIVVFMLAVAALIFGVDYIIRAVLQLLSSIFTG